MSSLKPYTHFASKLSLSALVLAIINVGYAAKPIDLENNALPLTISPSHALAVSNNKDSIKIADSYTDKKQVTHVGIQQMFAGVPVWGADAAVHLPKEKNRMALVASNSASLADQVKRDPSIQKNGTFYADIAKELSSADANVLNTESAKQAAIAHYKKEIMEGDAIRGEHWSYLHDSAQLFVYNDENNKARWIYQISITARAPKKATRMPTALVDAKTYEVLEEWDNVKHEVIDTPATAVGRGGNPVAGDWQYDGVAKPLLSIRREDSTGRCFLKNSEVEVRSQVVDLSGSLTDNEVISFSCAKSLSLTNLSYQIPDKSAVNGAYSPENDAMYYGTLIKQLYDQWTGVPVLYKSELGNSRAPMTLIMNILHFDDGTEYENAFWDPDTKTMNFGLGSNSLYPFVTLGIAAHEVSHGFTDMKGNANLAYREQSGALNESFSDMASAAISYFDSGEKSTDWLMGWDIYKENVGKSREQLTAIRYFESPEKDGSSISNAKDYRALKNQCIASAKASYPLDTNQQRQSTQSCIVHLASGVFNKAFYLLANTNGWNTKLAFQTMVTAQRHKYWRVNSNFTQAACGVKKAALDVMSGDKQQITDDVVNVFKQVGISLTSSNCK